MAINTSLELFLVRSVAKFLRDALPSLASIIQWPGMQKAAGFTDEEWIAFYPLSIARRFSSAQCWDGAYLFQVSCFSKFAELRDDGSTDRPFALAALVRDAMENENVRVLTYGTNPLAFAGCVTIGEGDQVYLNERAVGFTGASGQPTSDVHGVAVTFRGHMTTA